MGNENVILLFYFFVHLIVQESQFSLGTMPAVITVMVDTKELAESPFKMFTYGPPLLFPPGFFSDHRIHSFKAASFFSTRGNKILIHITFVTVRVRIVLRSWRQQSRLSCSKWWLSSCVVCFLPDVFVFCWSEMKHRFRQSYSRGPSAGPSRNPRYTPTDLLCAHYKHSRGAKGGSSPWTPPHTHTYTNFSGRQVERVPAVYINHCQS